MFGLLNIFGHAPVFCGVRHADIDLGGSAAITVPGEFMEMEDRASRLDDRMCINSFDSFDRNAFVSFDL